MKLLN